MGSGITLQTGGGATPLDASEAEGLIPTHITTQGELNAWEQQNIIRGEQWALARKRNDLLTEGFVRLLHRRMFDETWEWAGVYRKTGKNLGVPPHQISTSVYDACATVKYWLQRGTFPIDEIAVRLHHQLVQIHPFPNGNGRHTRLMADLLLRRTNQRLFTWGHVNLGNPGTMQKQYLDALKQADNGDVQALRRFAQS
jgi:Fic-DOC domain mobile mystery protein B